MSKCIKFLESAGTVSLICGQIWLVILLVESHLPWVLPIGQGSVIFLPMAAVGLTVAGLGFLLIARILDAGRRLRVREILEIRDTRNSISRKT